MRQVQSNHDGDVGLRGEELVLGEPEYEALEDLVGHRDAGLPQDQSQVEARRLGAGAVAARVHVFHEGSLKQITFGIYRDEIYSLQILLSRTQAGPGRTVKQEQEETSPNLIQRLNLISVHCSPCTPIAKLHSEYRFPRLQ